VFEKLTVEQPQYPPGEFLDVFWKLLGKVQVWIDPKTGYETSSTGSNIVYWLVIDSH
jgi:hypothetical protein